MRLNKSKLKDYFSQLSEECKSKEENTFIIREFTACIAHGYLGIAICYLVDMQVERKVSNSWNTLYEHIKEVCSD